MIMRHYKGINITPFVGIMHLVAEIMHFGGINYYTESNTFMFEGNS